MKSLYAREDMPKLVLTDMVNRRIDEIRTLYERKPILEDAKIFCNSTEQSLQLLLESMDSNDTRINDLSDKGSIPNASPKTLEGARLKFQNASPELELTTPTIEESLFADSMYAQLKAKSEQTLGRRGCTLVQPVASTSQSAEPMEISSSSQETTTSEKTSIDEPADDSHNKRPADLVVSAEKIKKIVEFTKDHSYGQAAKKFNKSKSFIQDVIESQRSGGTRRAKVQSVKDYCQSKFAEHRRNGNIIHYWNIQEWARQQATAVGLEGFKVSASFLNRFKKANNIVSRKITKFLTRREVTSEAEILQRAKEFVNDINAFTAENVRDDW
uniref:HTH CENPB-type domain-containing protein n=1 Tax=Tetranychus urticae TaxID=32264 RepID=T1KSL8_TETUR